MKIIVAVNHVREIGTRQTTALLIAAFVRAGRDVYLTGVDDLSAIVTTDGSRIQCRAFAVPPNAETSVKVAAFGSTCRNIAAVRIHTEDVILIRTNPGRDKSRAAVHAKFLDIGRVAEWQGIRVFNSPRQLEFFASKSSLLGVDASYIPASLVSSNPSEIAEFVRLHPEGCVLKPTSGSRGEGVIRLSQDTQNLKTQIKAHVKNHEVITQAFVSQTVPGDKRVVVMDGQILEVDGHPAGIERRPAEGDFRANLHAGGTAHPLTLTTEERDAATVAAGLLNQHGIRLAGVDLIGGRIIEFNVFSTGGLFDAELFSNCCFSDAIAQRLLAD